MPGWRVGGEEEAGFSLLDIRVAGEVDGNGICQVCQDLGLGGLIADEQGGINVKVGHRAGFFKNFREELLFSGGYRCADDESLFVCGGPGGGSAGVEEHRGRFFEAVDEAESICGGLDGRPGQVAEERVGFDQQAAAGSDGAYWIEKQLANAASGAIDVGDGGLGRVSVARQRIDCGQDIVLAGGELEEGDFGVGCAVKQDAVRQDDLSDQASEAGTAEGGVEPWLKAVEGFAGARGDGDAEGAEAVALPEGKNGRGRARLGEPDGGERGVKVTILLGEDDGGGPATSTKAFLLEDCVAKEGFGGSRSSEFQIELGTGDRIDAEPD